MELRHEVVSSLRWSAAAKLGGQILNWAITIFVIRLLVPGDYGLMAIANVFMGLLGIVAEMGFGASLIQVTNLEADRIRRLFGAALLVNCAMFLVLVAGAPLIARFYDEGRLTLVVQISALQFLIATICLVPDALLRRSLQFKKLSAIEIVSGLSGNIATLVLASLGKGVWALVIGGLAATSLRAMLLQATAGRRVMPSFRLAGTRSLVSFGANVTSMRFLAYAFTQCDTLIAGKVLGKDGLGHYSVAVHLATLPMQRISTIINDVAFPAFSRIQNDRRAVATNLRLAIRMMSLIAFPMLWGLASVTPELVRIAMGPKWIDSIIPLQIVSAVIPLRMVNSIVSTATVGSGHADIGFKTSVIAMLIAPPAFYLGAQFGIIGLAVAWLFVTPLVVYTNVSRSSPRVGVSLQDVLHDIARPGLASLLMAIGVYACRFATSGLGDGGRVAILIATGVLLYVVATVLVNGHSAVQAMEIFAPRIVSTRLRRVFDAVRRFHL